MQLVKSVETKLPSGQMLAHGPITPMRLEYRPAEHSVQSVRASASTSERPTGHSRHEKPVASDMLPAGHSPTQLPTAFSVVENRPEEHHEQGVDESESSSDCPASQLVQFVKSVEPGAAYVPLGQMPTHTPLAPMTSEYRPVEHGVQSVPGSES